jgi:DNA invertase Pin-like site-specific DNA recombinase
MTSRDTKASTPRKSSGNRRRPRYAGFGRVSRVADRGDRLRSPEQQTAAMENFARSEGIELDEIVIELDVSGSKVNESELMRLVARVEAGELDGILVPKLDRLSRMAPRERIELVERIGLERLLSATESNDVATPEGRFVRELFFSLARMEWERYARQFEVAKANAIDKGIAIKRLAPFGYRFDGEHRLELVRREARIVLEMFRLRAGGASYGDVLHYFERESGRSSSRQTMRDMLANRAYLGELRYGRGERELVNAGAHDPVPGLTVELFESVQAVNAERSRTGNRWNAGRPKSLLAGIAKCEGCGRGLVQSAGGGAGNLYYKCPNDSRHCTRRASILAAELDAHVTDRVIEWAGPMADELVELELELEPIGERIEREHRLAEAEASLRAWASDVEQELADELAYRAGLTARAELVERRRRELEELGEASEIEIARSTLRRALAPDSDELDVDERRRLLAVVLASVTVRRTPRRGAPAAERAVLAFTPAPSSVVLEHGAELAEQTLA